jgi:hypothetical protein
MVVLVVAVALFYPAAVIFLTGAATAVGGTRGSSAGNAARGRGIIEWHRLTWLTCGLLSAIGGGVTAAAALVWLAPSSAAAQARTMAIAGGLDFVLVFGYMAMLKMWAAHVTRRGGGESGE